MITYLKDLFAKLFTVPQIDLYKPEDDNGQAANEPLGAAKPQAVGDQPARTVPIVPVLTSVVESEDSKYIIQRSSDGYYMSSRRLPGNTYAWELHQHDAMEFKSLADCEKVRSITPDKTRRVVV